MARSRHYEYYEDGYWQYDGTSDFGRIQRQNAFLKALINQAEKQYNPLTLNAFIGSVVQGVTIDSTFTISELVSLAQQFRSFASTSLATATLPTYSSSSSDFASYGSVLYVQQPQANEVISQFLGAPAPVAATPPPGPYGVVATTTTTAPSHHLFVGRWHDADHGDRRRRPPRSRPASTPLPAEQLPLEARGAGGGSGGGAGLVEALGQGVPAECGALDPHRELHDALQCRELAQRIDVDGLGLGGLGGTAVRSPVGRVDSWIDIICLKVPIRPADLGQRPCP